MVSHFKALAFGLLLAASANAQPAVDRVDTVDRIDDVERLRQLAGGPFLERRPEMSEQDLLADVAGSKSLRRFLDVRWRARLDGWLTEGGRAPVVGDALDAAADGLLHASGLERVTIADHEVARRVALIAVGCRVAPEAMVVGIVSVSACDAAVVDATCMDEARAIVERSSLLRTATAPAGGLSAWIRASDDECAAATDAAWVAELEHHLIQTLGDDLGHLTGVGALAALLEGLDDQERDAMLDRMESAGHLTPQRIAEFGSAGVCRVPTIQAPTGPFGSCGMPGRLDGDALPQSPLTPPGAPGPDPSPIERESLIIGGPVNRPLDGMEPLNPDTWVVAEECRHIDPKYLLGEQAAKPANWDFSQVDEKKFEGYANDVKDAAADLSSVIAAGQGVSEVMLAFNKWFAAVSALNAVKAEARVAKIVETAIKVTTKAANKAERQYQETLEEDRRPPAGAQRPTADGVSERCGADVITALLSCMFPEGAEAVAQPGALFCESALEPGLPPITDIAPILAGDETTGLVCSCGGLLSADDYQDKPEYDSDCLESCPDGDMTCYETCNDDVRAVLCGDAVVPGGALATLCGAWDPSPIGDPEGGIDDGPAPCPPYDLNCDQGGEEPGPPECPPDMPFCGQPW